MLNRLKRLLLTWLGRNPEELARRKEWFQRYCEQLDNSVIAGPNPPHLFACPCCRQLTLSERGGFDICPVCAWEDDGQDDHDADIVRGGPNGRLSLTQARANYEERSRAGVRSPHQDDGPEAG